MGNGHQGAVPVTHDLVEAMQLEIFRLEDVVQLVDFLDRKAHEEHDVLGSRFL